MIILVNPVTKNVSNVSDLVGHSAQVVKMDFKYDRKPMRALAVILLAMIASIQIRPNA